MQELVIQAERSERQYWRDVWAYRELLYFLAWRDILVRYKQTVIGIAWAVVRPFTTMVVFTIIFGKLAKLPSAGSAPYAIMVFAALLPWQFFSNALTECSKSLVGNANLVAKVYFPRLIMPASSVVTSCVDLLIGGLIMAGLMAWYGYVPDCRVLALALFVAAAFAAAAGPGLWIAALAVKYRDFQLVVPFVVQLGTYISPVGFNSQVIPHKWRLLYSLNPMVGVIDGFRWCLLPGDVPLYWPGLIASVLVSIALCWSGIWYFRKVEDYFADVI
jgi:lipopolysaccharide transport system permease protein